MKKRLILFLLAVALCLCPVLSGAYTLPAATPGQAALARYLNAANGNLAALGLQPVNSLFECYESFAELGVTSADDSDTPESVTLTFTLSRDGLNTLLLRCRDLSSFPGYAAACLQAASAAGTTLEEAMKVPAEKVQAAMSSPANSFEEPVSELSGARSRAYYAYFPNQYHDGDNWIQLTLVFAVPGSEDASVYSVTSEATAEIADEYEGFLPVDEYDHYEIFSTATPEPDSAAASPWY